MACLPPTLAAPSHMAYAMCWTLDAPPYRPTSSAFGSGAKGWHRGSRRPKSCVWAAEPGRRGAVASLGSCLWAVWAPFGIREISFELFSVIGTMKSLQLRTTPQWWQLRTDSLVSPNLHLSGLGRGGNLVCSSALAGLDFVHMRTSRQIQILKSRVRECLKEGLTRVNLKC